MTQVSASALALARQILSHETGGSIEPEVLVGAAEHIDMRLREQLADLIGLLGYTTLCSRALRLVQTESRALAHTTVGADAGTVVIHDFAKLARVSATDPRLAETSLVAMLAYIIALLSIFIGEDLTLRLVSEWWPDLDPAQNGVGGE